MKQQVVQQEKQRDILDFLRPDQNCLDHHDDSQIATFYSGKSVFITGASGFVGKCLLEKLLRSCPQLKSVYILLRSKRGVGVKERAEILKKSSLFDRLRESEIGEHQLNKIKPVEGDITEPVFGLTESQIRLLSGEVSIVFHSAATVKFAEPLKVAVDNNVVSVDNLVNFACELEKLEALVHVSTAYSNCDLERVEEKFYEPPVNARKLIDMTRWMKPDQLESITPGLLGRRPNTYTFTKAVAESLLAERTKRLLPHIPVVMVRPSIVACTWQQPIRGWVDNVNGPTGVFLSVMSGVNQGMPGTTEYCADIVPVDVVANLIICTAWNAVEQHSMPERRLLCNSDSNQQNDNISVFNCVSGTVNPVYWRDVITRVLSMSKQYPCNNMLRNPSLIMFSNNLAFNAFNFFNNTALAHAGDFFLKAIGRKPTFVNIHNRFMKMVETLKPFTTNQWLFEAPNVSSLYDRLSPVDKRLFNFDVRQVRWDDYIDRYYIGARTYAMKEDPKALPAALHKSQVLNKGGKLAQVMLLLIAYYFLLSGTQLEEFVIKSLAGLFSFDARAFNIKPNAGIATT